MSSTGCCAAHHRWLKFNSNPPLCKLLNFKCRPFDYVVSSAPNKNGRHPQIDSCQRELLLSAVSKLGTKATDAGSPAAHLPKNFSRFDLRRRGGFPLQASLSLCHYFLPFIKPRFHIALWPAPRATSLGSELYSVLDWICTVWLVWLWNDCHIFVHRFWIVAFDLIALGAKEVADITSKRPPGWDRWGKGARDNIIWNLECIFSYFTSSSHLIQVRSPWDLYNNAVINSVFENCLKCKSRSSSAVKARVQIIKSSNVPSIRRLIFDWNFLMWRLLW